MCLLFFESGLADANYYFMPFKFCDLWHFEKKDVAESKSYTAASFLFFNAIYIYSCIFLVLFQKRDREINIYDLSNIANVRKLLMALDFCKLLCIGLRK